MNQVLGNNYARVDIEMSKDDALSCAKDIISLTKDKAQPTFAFPLFLMLPNDAQGYTLVYAIATKRVKTARNDKGRIPMLELIAMAKKWTVYGACIGLCPETPWSVLLAFDNSMLHDRFEAKLPNTQSVLVSDPSRVLLCQCPYNETIRRNKRRQ